MDLKAVENSVWYANVAATTWLIYRLSAQNLRHKYRFLFWYLVADAGEALAGIAVRGAIIDSRSAYFTVYFAGHVTKLILAMFVVFELFQLSLAGHPALARWSRKTVGGGLAAVSLLAILGLVVLPPDVRNLPILQYFLAFERTMDLALVLLLLTITAFLAWFPVRLPKNVAYYIAGFSAFFLARWLGAYSLGLYPAWRTQLSIAELAFALICLVAMGWWMGASGERETVVIGHRWNAGEMERLNRQLEAINAGLTRSHG